MLIISSVCDIFFLFAFISILIQLWALYSCFHGLISPPLCSSCKHCIWFCSCMWLHLLHWLHHHHLLHLLFCFLLFYLLPSCPPTSHFPPFYLGLLLVLLVMLLPPLPSFSSITCRSSWPQLSKILSRFLRSQVTHQGTGRCSLPLVYKRGETGHGKGWTVHSSASLCSLHSSCLFFLFMLEVSSCVVRIVKGNEYPSACIYFHLSVYLPIYLFIYLTINLSIYIHPCTHMNAHKKQRVWRNLEEISMGFCA